MTTEELYEKLCNFNEDEKFYETYYDARKKKWKLDEFLKNLNYQELLERRLIIPEANTGYMPSSMSDETYFELSDKNSIVLNKHNRYTPAFRHRHVFFELVYVLTGSCTQRINQDEVTITEGQFCLLAPYTTHSIGVFDDSIIVNILIRRSTFEDIFYDMLRDTNKIAVFFNQTLFSTTQNSYLILDTARDAMIREQVLTMFLEYINKKNYYEKILNSQLMILFAKILQLYEDKIQYPALTHKGNETCMQIIGYIEKNFKTVTLSSVCNHFHFSEGYCSRLIKEHTGKSFTQIVQELRFQQACSLLTSSNISIAEISSLSGFKNVEHFNRLFKKRYQLTPGQYRIQETTI